MYQAGIKKITLYENIGINFTRYDPMNLRVITDLVAGGAVIEIENMQHPEYSVKSKFKNGKLAHDYKVEFLLLGMTLENYDLIQQIKSSIYGWAFLVEFYDGSFRFYNTPVRCLESEIKPQDEMSFKVTLENVVPSVAHYMEYAPNISTTAIYRADTTILTADSTIYTADYAL